MFEKLQFWKKEDSSLDSNPFESAQDEHPFGADTTNPFTNSQNQVPPSFDQQGSNNPFETQPAGMDYTSQQQPQQNQYGQQQQNDPYPKTLGGAEFSQAQQVGTQQQSNNSTQYQSEMNKRDVELILSRLDLIKSELDNVQHKLSLLEKQNQKPKW